MYCMCYLLEGYFRVDQSTLHVMVMWPSKIDIFNLLLCYRYLSRVMTEHKTCFHHCFAGIDHRAPELLSDLQEDC